LTRAASKSIWVFVGYHQNRDRQGNRIEWIGADAAEDLHADDDGQEGADDDEPPGGRSGQHHGNQQSDQGGIAVADSNRPFAGIVEQQFPEDRRRNGQADDTQCRRSIKGDSHESSGKGGDDGVVASLGNPAAVMPERCVGYN
jgi:hypothetical protein